MQALGAYLVISGDATAGVMVASTILLGRALAPVLAGQKAGDWEDPTGLSHDVIVRMAPEYHESQQDHERMPVATVQVDAETGAPVMVPLGQVAALRRGRRPGTDRGAAAALAALREAAA